MTEARHRMFKWAVAQDYTDEIYPRDQDDITWWVAEVATELGYRIGYREGHNDGIDGVGV